MSRLLPFRVILICGDPADLHPLLERAADLAPRTIGIMLRDPEHRREVVLGMIESVARDRPPENVVPIVNGDPDGLPVPTGWWRHLPSSSISRGAGLDARFGLSVHSADELRGGDEVGADYHCISPVFPTGSKPGHPGIGTDRLAELCAASDTPVLALGGVTTIGRVEAVLRAGAFGFATKSGGTLQMDERLKGMLARLDLVVSGRRGEP